MTGSSLASASGRTLVQPLGRVTAAAGLGGVLGIALLLRVYDLGYKSLWIDEAYTYYVARGSLRSVWTTLVSDHVPGYFVLMWGAVRVLGGAEWALRLPSAIAGAAALAGVWVMGRELGYPRGAAIATVLGAFFPFAVYWSQEAKPEGLWMALSTWAFVCLLAAWRRRARGLWLAYWGLSLAGLYTFYLHVLVLAAQNLVVLTVLIRQRAWRRTAAWVGGQSLLVLAFAPWLATHLVQASQDVSAWANLGDSQWVAGPLSATQFIGLNANALLGGDPNPTATPTPSTLLVLAALAAIVVAVGTRPAWRRLDVGWSLLISWIGVPLAAAYVLQSVVLPAYQTRYVLACVPAVLIVFGIGLDRLTRRSSILGFSAAAVLVIVWCATTLQLYDGEPYQHAGHREAAAYVLAHQHPGDIFTADPEWQALPFWYYLPSTDDFTPLPLDQPVEVAKLLDFLHSHGAPGVWVAVQARDASQLDPILARMAEPAQPPQTFHGISLRYYRFTATQTED